LISLPSRWAVLNVCTPRPPPGAMPHYRRCFFWHGYLSSKEVYAWAAVALAQAGFRVIMPDAQAHGSRFTGDHAWRLSHFWEILRSNIDELPQLEAALHARGWVEKGCFSVAGASMGGHDRAGEQWRAIPISHASPA
jgi:alpha-beta hydrolase superfamily lysophospholipase